MGQILATTLPKEVSEVIAVIFDFSGFDEARAGETLSSPSIPAVAGLTIGDPGILDADTNFVPSGLGVQVSISGGTAGTSYTIKCYGTFSGGAVRVVEGQINVE